MSVALAGVTAERVIVVEAFQEGRVDDLYCAFTLHVRPTLIPLKHINQAAGLQATQVGQRFFLGERFEPPYVQSADLAGQVPDIAKLLLAGSVAVKRRLLVACRQ